MTTQKVTIIAPNPAIDRIYTIQNFTPGKVFRSTSETILAGGKPMNVARTLRRLNPKVKIEFITLLSEETDGGKFFLQACKDLDIALHVVPISQPLRHCIIIVDLEN